MTPTFCSFTKIVGALLILLAAADFSFPQELSISFWCGPPAENVNLERYRELAAAGFNLVMPPCEGEQSLALNLRILDTAKATGLKAFIFDPRMPRSITYDAGAPTRIDTIIADYSKHPALAGYFLTDEPSAREFAGLGEVVAYFRQHDPTHNVFINLFPDYASAEQLGESSYSQYVADFIRKVKPSIVSYDYYPFLKEGDRTSYFANLRTIASLSAREMVPFWQIALSVKHGPYREPNESEKRWAAMQTLAYGGKGVLYYTYWTPPGSEYTNEAGIIARSGARSRHFSEVTRINRDVRAIGKYLTGATHVTTNQNKSENGKSGLGITIGEFRLGSQYYALFANLDYAKPTEQDLVLKKGVKTVELLEKTTGKWRKVKTLQKPTGEYLLRLSLPPGDGQLYRW